MLVSCKYFKISVDLLIVYRVNVLTNFMSSWHNVYFQLSCLITKASFFFNWIMIGGSKIREARVDNNFLIKFRPKVYNFSK